MVVPAVRARVINSLVDFTGESGCTSAAALKAAGFDSVRIPIKWSAHAAKTAPYTIDPAFMDRVDHVVRTWLPQQPRPLVRRPGRVDV